MSSNKYQYYYKNNECKEVTGNSKDCICWFDEGTGPRPELRPDRKEPTLSIVWRSVEDSSILSKKKKRLYRYRSSVITTSDTKVLLEGFIERDNEEITSENYPELKTHILEQSTLSQDQVKLMGLHLTLLGELNENNQC